MRGGIGCGCGCVCVSVCVCVCVWGYRVWVWVWICVYLCPCVRKAVIVSHAKLHVCLEYTATVRVKKNATNCQIYVLTLDLCGKRGIRHCGDFCQTRHIFEVAIISDS